MARILIVDDAPHTHRLLTLMLERINHTTITAESGPQALEQLENSPVDLMITDLNMPNMNGFALMERVRANEKFKNLPIIMLTASGQQQAPMVAAEKGANRFLTQPISSWELNRVVTECLSLIDGQSG
ncbi:MAG: response regulator [Anaerolineales bacterium]|nr:response regulator [Anaerolineales bacterium]MCB8987611.1 response regulator [Ardenticatenaceae bacterium]